ncbi:hypothetical protein EBE87_01320 [Pseudoroseomonas wenyumeiae]|uniref:Uncharacterized protein n=1 Tax=Teichococcus wenyumeiae TaxID=2478470 RepID=A0A3A9JEI4_9PROT|nr:hypothetical protein [Pseudoroseomonas wenyumeiae]RKK03083.1 hypothetical protein D6Z83_16420 [Pseudoroseomonas wenyumeiae]RMI27050.1 hypothetical protein EBE87_01320 [Pseudoroseomonas wenyumeiae]
MQTTKLALALGLGLTLAGGAQAQPGSGTAPNTGATQAPAPQPNRPQSDSRVGQSPQPQAANLRDYANLLKEAQQRLETAVERSGNEPAANDQKAVTPAWMDLKSAAQAAYDAVNRAPPAIRNDNLYDQGSTQIRQNLGVITQSMQPENGREAAKRLLDDMRKYTAEVSRRAEASPG